MAKTVSIIAQNRQAPATKLLVPKPTAILYRANVQLKHSSTQTLKHLNTQIFPTFAPTKIKVWHKVILFHWM